MFSFKGCLGVVWGESEEVEGTDGVKERPLEEVGGSKREEEGEVEMEKCNRQESCSQTVSCYICLGSWNSLLLADYFHCLHCSYTEYGAGT